MSTRSYVSRNFQRRVRLRTELTGEDYSAARESLIEFEASRPQLLRYLEAERDPARAAFFTSISPGCSACRKRTSPLFPVSEGRLRHVPPLTRELEAELTSASLIPFWGKGCRYEFLMCGACAALNVLSAVAAPGDARCVFDSLENPAIWFPPATPGILAAVSRHSRLQ